MTRSILRLLPLALALGSVGLYAPHARAADDTTNATSDVDESSGRKISYKSKTEIDFEGLDVEGEMVKPSSALVLDRKKASFNPLIKMRENFNPEMEESIDEVR